MPHRLRRATAGLACSLLMACAAPAGLPLEWTTADALLLGELHDDEAHQRRHREVIESLATRGRLGAVALEMAEQGVSTAGLPRSAEAAAVRAALRWNDEAWPWSRYGPAVMAAVAAGIPVFGANLPRDRMRPAMADAALDLALDADALAAQREAIRKGHCDLMPERQLAPMARVQVARDRAMAQVLAQAAKPGQVVVLLAGAGHVDPRLGVPRHLPGSLRVQSVALPRQAPPPAVDP
ncbi:MAG TPA: ChaN family lipoprotein, partial [Ramlibacter sp.]|nr:ChaN family lipoprotein [Ramlibacter sp.]